MAKKHSAEDKILKDLGQFQITRDTPRFSELEERVLALYDELEEVRLEQALLQSSAKVTKETDLSGDELQKAIKVAEQEALKARASYKLRNSVVGNVVAVDPVLKAIHAENDGNTSASTMELKRLLAQRDVLCLTQTHMATDLHEVQSELAQTQLQTIKAVSENRQLASKVYELAASLDETEAETIEDEELRERLAESKRTLDQARRTRKLLKNVVSGIVAGSGINWSQDEALRALVLDVEDD